MDSSIAITTFVAMVDHSDLRLNCKMGVGLLTLLRMVVVNTSGHLGHSQDDLQRILLP
jgi:hypothetical protein